MKPSFLLLIVLAGYVFLTRTHLAAQEATRLADDQAVDVIFSHRYHVEEEAMACADCHGDAESSAAGTDNLLPSMELCGDCHDIDAEDDCGTCHRNPDDPGGYPVIDTYSRLFSHARHLEAEGADLTCETCHDDVAGYATVDAPLDLPEMPACMDCHEDEGADNACLTCHTKDEPLTPASHVHDFRHTHGDLASLQAPTPSGMTCATCHDDDYCQDCHEGENLDRFTHPLNYAFTHALDAQANDLTCSTCHTDRTFCVDCHRDNQVLPHTHTPGWATQVGGGRHRIEAMNDLESCMACHEQNADLICQPCHG